MQERYVSLDPHHADVENAKVRSEVFDQRLFEAEGGQPTRYLSTQFGATGGLCTYVYMRKRGFRVLPLQAVKTPQYLSIYLGAFAASWFAKSLAMRTVGDREQFKYLLFNKSAILSGTMPMDQQE
jgi:hypothetical protein